MCAQVKSGYRIIKDKFTKSKQGEAPRSPSRLGGAALGRGRAFKTRDLASNQASTTYTVALSLCSHICKEGETTQLAESLWGGGNPCMRVAQHQVLWAQGMRMRGEKFQHLGSQALLPAALAPQSSTDVRTNALTHRAVARQKGGQAGVGDLLFSFLFSISLLRSGLHMAGVAPLWSSRRRSSCFP